LRCAPANRQPLGALAATLVPVSIAGLVLALGTGTLLFATRPFDYIGEPLFGLKLGLLAAAVANALLLRRSSNWTQLPSRPRVRRAGLTSLLLWLGVITAGRLIGYP
jgi:hypothetical protein